jgi:NAD(P)-dependent dehydrogenase (short-subunit alcohol dehydrogenase family)
MNITFENKVALVTGAASGLGLATAKASAEAGASVVLADWNEREVQAAAKGLANKVHRHGGFGLLNRNGLGKPPSLLTSDQTSVRWT